MVSKEKHTLIALSSSCLLWSVGFIYTLILMVSKEKHTLTTLSSSWLLRHALVLSTLSFLWWAKRNTLTTLSSSWLLWSVLVLFTLSFSWWAKRNTLLWHILFLPAVACVLSTLSFSWWANTLLLLYPLRATVACSSFIYTIILMVSKEKNTLTTLSSSWLLWPALVLSTQSFLWWAKRNTLLLLYPLPGCCGRC